MADVEIGIKRLGGSAWVEFWVKVDVDDVREEFTVEMTEYCLMMSHKGHVLYGTRGGRDISNRALDRFEDLMETLIRERERPYDSTALIELLFEKMLRGEASRLIKTLTRNYGEESESDQDLH